MGLWNRIIGRKADPVILDSPEKLLAFLQGGGSGAGVSVNATKAMQYAAYASCVRVIAESIGMLPLFLYEQRGNSREKAKNEKLYSLLNVAPNDYMTARQFWTMAGALLAGRGNFYAYKNRVGGEVAELLPLPAGTVKPKLRADWTKVYEGTLNGRPVVWNDDEVMHIHVFTMDGVSGMDPISYMREVLGEGIASDQQASKQFTNGAKLSGVLSTDGTLSDDAYNRIRASWNETYGGASNAYKVAILEAGLNFNPIAMTNEQAQFIDLRKYKRSEVAGLFRVPPHKIGDLEHATFSNIEHQAQEFVTDCLMPYLTAIEAGIRTSLIPAKDRVSHFAKFNLSALLRGDMAARAAFYHSLMQDGAISPNQIREFEDWNPREGGDIYLTPMNMLINGKPPEPAKPPANQGSTNGN